MRDADYNVSRYSILPALSLDGIPHVKVIEGSYNSARFFDFISGVLDNMNPFPNRNSAIIMDNCKIHNLKAQEIPDLMNHGKYLFILK